MKRSPQETRATSRRHAAHEEQTSSAKGHSTGAGAGIAHALTLARRLGNQALERVLRAGRQDASQPSGVAGADGKTVADFSQAAGVDLSGVHVVDDADAHLATDALGATALAAGDRVLLGRDAPPPASAARERLLAHELAHVAQQRTSASLTESVSQPGDAHERAADATAARTMRGQGAGPVLGGAAPAVQLQKKTGENAGLDRAAAQQRLEAYFTRVLAQQGGKAVAMTEDVKTTLRRIFVNDMAGLLKFDSFLTRTIYPGSPSELAAMVAQYLPDPIDDSRLVHLDAPGPVSTKMGRLKSLAQKTEPYVSPDTQMQQWEFDRQAKEARRGDKGVVGPVGVDLNRLLNIGKGLSGALADPKKPARQTGAPNAALDSAIASIDPNALTPAEARGGQKANEFADAQLVARGIAGDLDRAQGGKDRSITLRLDAVYSSVKDREAIIAEIARIARLVRDALPHKASAVQAIDLYFGDKVVRRISLAGTDKTEGSP